MTFIQLPKACKKTTKPKVEKSRNFSQNNVENFKRNLQNFTWLDVLQSNDVNESYENFWNKFKMLYDLNFPLKVTKFNKNLHKLC
jgi:hypothetical protein